VTVSAEVSRVNGGGHALFQKDKDNR